MFKSDLPTGCSIDHDCPPRMSCQNKVCGKYTYRCVKTRMRMSTNQSEILNFLTFNDVVIFSLVPATNIGYTYSLIGTGYCSDYVSLPSSGLNVYLLRLNADDPLFDSDPIQECMNRCLYDYGKAGLAWSTSRQGKNLAYWQAKSGAANIGSKAFFLNTNNRCSCAIGDCSYRYASGPQSYQAYAMISGNS